MTTAIPVHSLRRRLIKACTLYQQSLIDGLDKRLSRITVPRHVQRLNGDSTSVIFGDRDFMEESLYRAKEQLRVLKYITSVIDKVYQTPEAGAVVVTDRRKFFIATNIGPFKADNHTFFGISTKSGEFISMQNKRVHDVFNYQGVRHVIKDIF